MVEDVGHLSSSTPCVLCSHSYNILLYLKQQTESVFSEKILHFRGYGVSMIQTSRICIKRNFTAMENFGPLRFLYRQVSFHSFVPHLIKQHTRCDFSRQFPLCSLHVTRDCRQSHNQYEMLTNFTDRLSLSSF